MSRWIHLTEKEESNDDQMPRLCQELARSHDLASKCRATLEDNNSRCTHGIGLEERDVVCERLWIRIPLEAKYSQEARWRRDTPNGLCIKSHAVRSLIGSYAPHRKIQTSIVAQLASHGLHAGSPTGNQHENLVFLSCHLKGSLAVKKSGLRRLHVVPT